MSEHWWRYLSDIKNFLSIFCLPGNREIPAESEQRHSHIPVAKFRFDVGQIAKHILSPTTTSETNCKHLSLIVEGLETQLRIATLSRIVDLINSVKPSEIVPMRIDAVDVRLTLQATAMFCFIAIRPFVGVVIDI